jgi:hypothetical protein
MEQIKIWYMKEERNKKNIFKYNKEKIKCLIQNLKEILPGESTEDILAILNILYIWRINDADSFDIWYENQYTKDFIKGAEGYFSDCIPLRIEINPNQRFKESYFYIKNQIVSQLGKKTFLKDIFIRYPNLREKAGDFKRKSIIIQCTYYHE